MRVKEEAPKPGVSDARLDFEASSQETVREAGLVVIYLAGLSDDLREQYFRKAENEGKYLKVIYA
jgi:hypothetical protein